MAPYVTVFEITQKPYTWWPAIGLLMTAAGACLIGASRRWRGQKRLRAAGYAMLVFGPLWGVMFFYITFPTYKRSVDAYRSGHYAVVEGPVEQFRPMPYEGHQDECFTVRHREFCYSDYAIQPGFNRSASHGGPIRPGLPVRIAYLGGQILRLEARADSVPSPSERAAYEKAAEAKWRDH